MVDALSSILADRFATNAERVFIVDSTGIEVTYKELGMRAVAAVREMGAAGIVRGDRIGILLPHGLDFAVLYFACLLSGVTAVPINSALPTKDLSFILPRCGLKAIVVGGGEDALRRAIGDAAFTEVARLLRLDHRVLLSGPRAAMIEVEALLDRLDTSALFSIHFTSGTTSLPKGVPHSVSSLLGNAAAFNRTFGLDMSCVMLHVMPMAYMAGFLNTLLVPFMAGGKVILAREFSAQIVPRFWTPIVERNVNTIWMSPSMLAVLNKIDRDPAGPEYCRSHPFTVLSATAPLAMAVRATFEEKYRAPVIESYGLSELLLLTANRGPAGAIPHSVGPAAKGVELKIRDSNGRSVPATVDGDVFVRTPYAAIGYLDYDTGQPSGTSGGWFDTGDIGHLDVNGYLFITGRKKDLIIRGGFNVSPRTIEELLIQHGAIDAVAVVGAPHDFYGEEIVAAVQLRPGHQLEPLLPELRELCRSELGPQMIPDRIVSVAAFPTSVTGKIQKNLLRDVLRKTRS